MPSTNHQKTFADLFLLLVLVAALALCWLIFKPFLMTILLAGMLASIFFRPYRWLTARLGGRPNVAAMVMTIVVALVIIIPGGYFIRLLSVEAIDVVGRLSHIVTSGSFQEVVVNKVIEPLRFVDPDFQKVQSYLGQVSAKAGGYAVDIGAAIVRNTTNFILHFIILVLTLFFFFRDGQALLEHVMRLTPLSNRYDRAIFQKFRDVSYVSVISTFIIAIAQGIVGAIGFAIAGLPALVPGVLMAFSSLLPYVGPAIVWLPTGGYLLLTGNAFGGLAVIIAGVISGVVDNALRPYLMKGKTAVHPMIIFFSILGGIIAFGFWGIVLGPLIIALTFTLLHIYELEYGDLLER